jgi:hypothetical protein
MMPSINKAPRALARANHPIHADLKDFNRKTLTEAPGNGGRPMPEAYSLKPVAKLLPAVPVL